MKKMRKETHLPFLKYGYRLISEMAAAADRPKGPCPQSLVRILPAQLRNLIANPIPYLTAVPDPTDLRIWYVRIAGLDTPYKHGEYIFTLTVPDEFPHKPPRLIFLTPNGLFIPGHKVCISVGEFHTNDGPGRDGAYGWRPALGMRGFALEVVNALICSDTLGSGIGIAHSSPAEKQKLAEASRAYNAAHYPAVVADLEEYVLANPRAEPVVNLLAGRGEPVPAATTPAAITPAANAPAADAPAADAPAATTPAATAPAANAPAANAPAANAGAAINEIDALLQDLEKL